MFQKCPVAYHCFFCTLTRRPLIMSSAIYASLMLCVCDLSGPLSTKKQLGFFQITLKNADPPPTQFPNRIFKTGFLILYLFSLPFWAYRPSLMAAGSSQLMTDADTGVKMNKMSECLTVDCWDFFTLTHRPPSIPTAILTSLMLCAHILSGPLSIKINSHQKCYGWLPTGRTKSLAIKSHNQIRCTNNRKT